jgi:hypothetical protein
MGRRGKERAKHAKVARELKYQEIQTDFAALERELRVSPGSGQAQAPEVHDDDSPPAAGASA